jgi:MFS family permease
LAANGSFCMDFMVLDFFHFFADCRISSSESLIVFRILQGIFGAFLVPGSLAIINTNFPPENRGQGNRPVDGLGWCAFTAIGPLAGGYLIDAAIGDGFSL